LSSAGLYSKIIAGMVITMVFWILHHNGCHPFRGICWSIFREKMNEVGMGSGYVGYSDPLEGDSR
jgi:hypothetical protein